jgi:hypothetical protein
MKPDRFKTPVTILTGLGFPTEVCTVMHGYRLLLEWPALHTDPAHALALNACKAAIDGDIEAETARKRFCHLRRETRYSRS